MKIIFKILLLLVFLAVPVKVSFGQSAGSSSDSTHIVRKNDKSVDDSRQRKMNREKKLKKNQDQNDEQEQGPTATNSGNDNGGGLKKINSARPDMTRVRNARPPDIQRPSGGLLPRGIGRPGGAIRPGH